MTNTDINKRNRRLTIIYCAITLGIMAFIFVQSAMPDYVSAEESYFFVNIAKMVIGAVSNSAIDLELLSKIVRKLAHFTEYLVFGMSLVLSIKSLAETIRVRKPIEKTKSQRLMLYALPAWVFGTLYAVSDEFHQYFVPGRFCDWKDMCIDSAGVAIGCIIVALFFCALSRKTPAISSY